MNSPRNYLLIFFVLATLGGAALAWNQHLELIKLRAELQEKDLDAQLHQHQFEDKLAALRAHNVKAATNDGTPQTSSDDKRQRDRFGNMRAMMNDPNFVKYMELQQRSRLDSTYGPLFKQLTQGLNLSPAQLAAFQNLLVEKQSAARDVLVAARDQGLDPATDRAAIGQLVAQSNAEIDQQIQSTLGPDGFDQYQNFEQTMPERNTVNLLQQSLSSSGVSLTDSQTQQIIQLLAADAPKNASNPTSLRALFGGNATVPITPAEIPGIAVITGLSPSAIEPIVPPINAPYNIRPRPNPTAGSQPAGTATTTNR